MNLPWMPLYVADYLADTRRLSTLEHGAYLLLIMEYWQHGGLPDDDRALAKVCGLTPREWTRCRAALAPMFGEGWKHKRIDEELEKAAKNKETNTTRAAAAAKARYDKQARRMQEASNEGAPGLPEERSGHAPSMLDDHSKDAPSPSPREERVPYETLSSRPFQERSSATTARAGLLDGKPPPRASGGEGAEPVPDVKPVPFQDATVTPTRFPADGSIAGTDWAKTIAVMRATADPDEVAQRFRGFAAESAIELDDPKIHRTFVGWCQEHLRERRRA